MIRHRSVALSIRTMHPQVEAVPVKGRQDFLVRQEAAGQPEREPEPDLQVRCDNLVVSRSQRDREAQVQDLDQAGLHREPVVEGLPWDEAHLPELEEELPQAVDPSMEDLQVPEEDLPAVVPPWDLGREQAVTSGLVGALLDRDLNLPKDFRNHHLTERYGHKQGPVQAP